MLAKLGELRRNWEVNCQISGVWEVELATKKKFLNAISGDIGRYQGISGDIGRNFISAGDFLPLAGDWEVTPDIGSLPIRSGGLESMEPVLDFYEKLS